MGHRAEDRRRMVLAVGRLCSPGHLQRAAGLGLCGEGGVSGGCDLRQPGRMPTSSVRTATTGELRRMIYLDDTALIAFWSSSGNAGPAGGRFDENNWWKWGRRRHLSDAPHLREPEDPAMRPFFLHAAGTTTARCWPCFRTGRTWQPRTWRGWPGSCERLWTGPNWVFVCDGVSCFPSAASKVLLRASPLTRPGDDAG